MPNTVNNETIISATYVALFQRSPDQAGLNFWKSTAEQLESEGKSGNDLAIAMANQFAQHPAFTTIYSDLGNVAFIDAIYMNIGGKVADAAGRAYWLEKLEGASDPVTARANLVGEFIYTVLSITPDELAAQEADGTITSAELTDALARQDRLSNKAAVGLEFTKALGASSNLDPATDANSLESLQQDPAYLASQAIIAGVTEVDATTDAPLAYLNGAPTLSGINEMFGGGDEDQTFTLTTATDAGPAFVGGAGNDAFNANIDLGIGGLVGVQTLQGSDVLDGGEGFNALNAELNGTGALANPTISNIQQYNLTSFAGQLGGTGELDLGRATGYEQLWNRNSRVDLALTTVGEVAILGMDNVRDGSTYAVEYDNLAVETQVVVVNKSGTATSSVALDISGVQGNIGDLNLIVSNGVHLDLEDQASGIENLSVSGAGVLDLDSATAFANLQTLDTMGYVGDVDLDVSGSADLTSVVTADGDDHIDVGAASVNGGLAVDLGEGDNVLGVFDAGDETGINSLDFTGGVANVQTLELADDVALTGDAMLDLSGFDAELVTVAFDDVDAAGNDFEILAAPAVLEITAATEFDMDSGLFTIEGAIDLTMTSTGMVGVDSDVRLDGGVNSTTLETLVISAADDAELVLEGGTDALVSVDVESLGDTADVEINDLGALGSAAEFAAMTTVSVKAATDATLEMNGRAGVVGVAGTQATQSFTIEVTAGAASGGFPSTRTSAGNVFFTSGELAAGFVNTTYSTTLLSFLGANSALHDSGAASDIASALDATAELIATNTGNVVNVTWNDVGLVSDPLFYQAGSSAASVGTQDSFTSGAFTQGTEAIAQVDGEGFEAVQTVTVDALDGDAEVDLTDVYGAFTLNVTATDDANVDLFNTAVTTVTVAAGMDSGDLATVTVGGDTVGNADLVNLTVTGNSADVTLADNLDSFTTLDVSGVMANLVVDSALANFVVTPGNYIEYLVGVTSDANNATTDVAFTGNAVRELYDFVGSNIGNVEITNFTFGADPAIGDRIDLSGFAANAGQLVFTDQGADLVITDLAGGPGDFDGSITIVGAAGQDLSFNIIYG